MSPTKYVCNPDTVILYTVMALSDLDTDSTVASLPVGARVLHLSPGTNFPAGTHPFPEKLSRVARFAKNRYGSLFGLSSEQEGTAACSRTEIISAI